MQDGRIHIEKLNGPFLFKEGGTPGGVQCWCSTSPSRRVGCGGTRAAPR